MSFVGPQQNRQQARESSIGSKGGKVDTETAPKPEPLDDEPDGLIGSDADFVADTNRSFLSRLYTGTGAFEVVGKRRAWYIATAALVVACLLFILVRGFSFGIEFEGGTQVSVPVASQDITAEAVEEQFAETIGNAPDTVQTVGGGGSQAVQIRTAELDQQQMESLAVALADRFGPAIAPADVSSSDVSSTWGQQITNRMGIALLVFLVIVFFYITLRFDREMSIASLAALILDLVVTAGIYALVGWEVTPATVIGLLTVLGFSIYDTVVVFDKVSENTRSVLHTSRRTYAEQANLAVNQTFMRSINTTVISALPIIALMIIAVWLLGVGTLKDLALIQLVGVIIGTYSSVFFATPLLVTLKERKSDVAEHTKRVLERRAAIEAGEPVGAGVTRGAANGDSAAPSGKRRRSATSGSATAARGGNAVGAKDTSPRNKGR